ncbi:hypothetical protein [Marivita sp. S2033]|uniref:hypothetical protein n=1 Tax=Marivita sp. S2033 TaxID=3373187 RepID=UPI003982A90F
MAGFRSSLAGQALAAFLRGVGKAKQDADAKQSAHDTPKADHDPPPKIRHSPLRLSAFSPSRTTPQVPNLVTLLETAAAAREAEEEKARHAEQLKTHIRLLTSDPEYRARDAARKAWHEKAQARILAKREADLKKIRELAEYGRSRPSRERRKCYTCGGNGHYHSNRLEIEVDCIDCGGKGWQRSRY